MSIGSKIKSLRKSKKLTQTELANIIGTTKQTIYKYENGIITNIPSDKIEAIAKVLQTTPGELMGWEMKNGVPVPIPKDRSAVIEQIVSMPDDRFEEMAAKLEFAGYLEPEK